MTAAAGSNRRPRLDDVAAQVGVSPATVSLVLRGVAGPSAATRERVLAAADRLGYRPDRAASALASRRSRTVGVLIDISSTYESQLVLDLYDAAERRGYGLLLSTVNRRHDEERAAETLLDSRCAGLILLGPHAPKDALNRLGAQLPVVVIGREVPAGSVDVVRTADDDGVAEAVRHLAGLGHRRITFVTGPPGAVTALRRRGYETAMRDCGLAEWIAVVDGGLTEEDGVRAGGAIMAGAGASSSADGGWFPTGLVMYNDRSAIGLIDTFNRGGVPVPAAASVVGFDDSPVAALPLIDLTTVAQDTGALADNAMASLIERFDDGRTGRREVIVAPRLVVRGTTAPCRE